MENTDLVYCPLPAEIYGKEHSNPLKKLMDEIRSDVGENKFLTLVHDGSFDERVHTHPPKNRKHVKKTKPVRYLSRKARKANNLLKLPRTGWNFKALQPMRDMWLSYMEDNLEGITTAPDVTDKRYTYFHSILAKSDLVGAYVTVVKSRVPSMIDISGIVVLETRDTFQVVTPSNQLKILVKEPSVFSCQLKNIKLTIYGKSLMMRPHERCVKKIKNCINLDL